MQRTVDFRLPILDEFEQARMVGRDILVLPSERIQHALKVRHPIEKLSGRQPVSRQHQFRFRWSHVISKPVSMGAVFKNKGRSARVFARYF